MNYVRRFCTNVTNKKNYLVTTPLYYVNADPHLGHLYSSLLADVATKWQLLRNPNSQVLFLTGVDEHGEKVARAAQNSPGAPKPYDYCTKISESYKNMSKTFNVGYGSWVRTTDANHLRTVETFWGRLMDRGFISLADYKGWYCIADESFVRDDEIKVENGIHINVTNNQPLEWREEANYVFKPTPEIKREVLKWLRVKNGTKNRIHPIDMQAWAEKLMQEDLETNNEGISVSRPSNRVPWALTVPNDPNHTIYVWLDALCGYLSGANWPNESHNWPADLHILGKDILRFHAILWPQLLLGADLELPQNLFVHSHWTVDHVKMSKSRGNVINPFQEAFQNSLTSEGLRYFLLREAVPHSDGNYSTEKARKILNSELADVFGNLLNRCCSKVVNPKGIRPLKPSKGCLETLSKEELHLCKLLENLPKSTEDSYELLETRKVVDEIISTLHRANECVEAAKPWKLAKNPDPDSQRRLQLILGLALETIRVCSILLIPIVPTLSSKCLDKLAVPMEQRFWQNARHHPWLENRDPQDIQMEIDGEILFKRILPPEDGKVEKPKKKAKR